MIIRGNEPRFNILNILMPELERGLHFFIRFSHKSSRSGHKGKLICQSVPTGEKILFLCALDEVFLSNWSSEVEISSGQNALEHLHRNNRGELMDG